MHLMINLWKRFVSHVVLLSLVSGHGFPEDYTVKYRPLNAESASYALREVKGQAGLQSPEKLLQQGAWLHGVQFHQEDTTDPQVVLRVREAIDPQLVLRAQETTAPQAGTPVNQVIGSVDLSNLTQFNVNTKYAVDITNFSKSGSAWNYGNFAYFLEGINSFTETNTSLADRLVGLIDNMFVSTGNAPTLRRVKEKNAAGVEREFQAWTGTSADPRFVDLDEIGLYHAATEIARSAAIILASPTLSARYGQKAREYLARVTDMAIERFYVHRYGRKIPWLSEKAWSVKAAYFGSMVAMLYQATGLPLYAQLAREVGEAFRGRLQNFRTGLVWDNRDGIIAIGSDRSPISTGVDVGNQAGAPDTQQAAASVKMMVYMYENNLVFGADHIRRAAETLTGTIWNGNSESPTFTNYIDGSDRPFRQQQNPGSNGAVGSGWGLLARHSQKVQDLLTDTERYILEAEAGRKPKNGSFAANSNPFSQISMLGNLTRYLQDIPKISSIESAAGGGPSSAVAVGSLIRVRLTKPLEGATTVTINGQNASVVETQGNDLLVLVQPGPSVPTEGRATLRVMSNGSLVATQSIDLAPVAPAFWPNGIFNPARLMTEQDPLTAGGFASMYVTGFLPPFGWETVIKIHDREVRRDRISWNGPTPGYVGVQQINFQIPDDFPTMPSEVLVCAEETKTGRRICSRPAEIFIRAASPDEGSGQAE